MSGGGAIELRFLCVLTISFRLFVESLKTQPHQCCWDSANVKDSS